MNPVEEWRLETSRIGKRVLVFDRLDSTNTFALGRADDTSNDGLVVIADEQTSGRGQQGRAWSCPGGAGVLMSVLVFPPAPLRRPVVMTAWAAAAVCELIEKNTGLESTIKWPNDVLIQCYKVCGILIEQTRGTVVGIGLNVNQPAEYFASAGLPQAASLAMFTGRMERCRDLARRLIGELDISFDRIRSGDLSSLRTSWKRRLDLIGKQVELETAKQKYHGLLKDISFDGLQLVLADGDTVQFTPESVRQLHAS